MNTAEMGRKIAELRKKNNLTQEEFAEKIGVTAQAVSKWETGKNIPDMDNLALVVKLFNVPYSYFAEPQNGVHLEYRLRLFNEDNMFTKIKTVAQIKGFGQTLKALEFMREKHSGQFRKGSKYAGSAEKVKYINHPLMMACHAYALGIYDDDILAAILLHDVVEDTDAALGDLPVSDEVKKIVDLVTFKKLPGLSKEESKKIYYEKIAENKKAATVKIFDRCNNISTMTPAFTREKQFEYINETEEYILPLISALKNEPAPYCDAAFVVKYHILSVLESIKPFL